MYNLQIQECRTVKIRCSSLNDPNKRLGTRGIAKECQNWLDGATRRARSSMCFYFNFIKLEYSFYKVNILQKDFKHH